MGVPEIAEALAAGRREGRLVTALDEPPRDLAEAYAVQAALFGRIAGGGASAQSGWKVGATTADMQRYLRVDGPGYGRIAHVDTHHDGVGLRRGGLLNPGIECEIAVRIAHDAPAADHDRAAAAALVADVMPAIEIVENRYDRFEALGMPTLVADNFFQRACVLGAPVAGWRALDLAEVHGRTLVDGEVSGTGRGADVMGHPLEVVAWLANTLRGHGLALRGGDVVLTGSVAPVVWLPDTARRATASLDGLGEVTAEFD